MAQTRGRAEVTAGIGKAEAETRSVTVRHRPAAPPETSISKKEPAIGDGCQSREVMLRSISRFPVLVCAAIHTLDDRFHEIGIDETGSMELEGSWWIPRLRLAERGAV